jgi:hypothetical protein
MVVACTVEVVWPPARISGTDSIVAPLHAATVAVGKHRGGRLGHLQTLVGLSLNRMLDLSVSRCHFTQATRTVTHKAVATVLDTLLDTCALIFVALPVKGAPLAKRAARHVLSTLVSTRREELLLHTTLAVQGSPRSMVGFGYCDATQETWVAVAPPSCRPLLSVSLSLSRSLLSLREQERERERERERESLEFGHCRAAGLP